MVNMLLIGPPGSGKGTQAKGISGRLGAVAISSGEIFRENVNGRTALGLEAQKYMNAGDLVPDSITNNMIRDRIAQQDAATGFLLDGYPRNVSQIDFLDGVLAERGQDIALVLEIVADEDELVRRLSRRASLEGREDDNAESIRYRLKVYRDQTQPVVARYHHRGIVVHVDGMGPIDEVQGRVSAALDSTLARSL
jgi:adenylate kinase